MAEHQVNSPMTGQIIEIPVGVGESVSEGDLLIVIESMKMEQSIEAPMDGTVDMEH